MLYCSSSPPTPILFNRVTTDSHCHHQSTPHPPPPLHHHHNIQHSLSCPSIHHRHQIITRPDQMNRDRDTEQFRRYGSLAGWLGRDIIKDIPSTKWRGVIIILFIRCFVTPTQFGPHFILYYIQIAEFVNWWQHQFYLSRVCLVPFHGGTGGAGGYEGHWHIHWGTDTEDQIKWTRDRQRQRDWALLIGVLFIPPPTKQNANLF